MIALLGPVPKSLVDRERNMRHWRWSPEARNHEGKLCNNAADFFGGPFFSDDGKPQVEFTPKFKPQLIIGL